MISQGNDFKILVKMKTVFLSDDENDIKKAGEIISKGGLVAFPTETVYGLGADGLNENAVSKIFAAKGRPGDNPLILHISEIDEIESIALEVDEKAKKLMKAFWPGPMTLILKARDIVPKKTTGGLDTVGIRMPNCDMARLLIKSAGTPIAAPSANTSGRPSPTTAKHVLEDMNGKINAILDGGDCQVGIESTIISTLGETVTILRPGAITKEDVERTLNEPVKFHESLLSTSDIIDRIGVSDTSSDVSVKKKSMSQNLEEDVVPMAPGMKYKHYAPKADMLLFIGDYDIVCKEIEKRKEIFQKQGKKVGVINYGCQSNLEISKRFFKDLRHMDEEKIDVILACGVSDVGLGFAVMNRMMKSAGYNIINLTEEKVGQKIDSRGENDTLPI